MRVKVIAAVVVIVFCASLAYSGELTQVVRFSESDLSFSRVDGYDLVKLEGYPLTGEAGRPLLPAVSCQWVLPPTAELTRVEVLSSRFIELPGEYRIHPAQKPRPISLKETLPFVKPDENVYSSSETYPGTIVKTASTGSMGGYRIGGAILHPLSYIPSQGQLRLHIEVQLRISYREGAVSAGWRTERQREFSGGKVKRLVLNPQDVDMWAPRPGEPRQSSTEYAIVTTSSYVDTLQRLADWLAKKGVPAEVKTVAWINSNYGGHHDTQENIREFLKDYYQNHGLVWVLLAGDISVVPHRIARVVASPYTEDIPCDLYFSDLDGTWDANGNHIYGQPDDNVDMYSDVWVGRASIESGSEASTFVNKVFTYEKNPSTDYLKKTVLPAVLLWPPSYYGDDVNNAIADLTPGGWQDSRLYESNGTLSRAGLRDSLDAGFGFCHYAAHGDADGVYYYTGGIVLNSNDAVNLTNGNRLGVHNSMACHPGAFDQGSVNGDCFAENLMNNPNGGTVACIMNSRYGWGTPPEMGMSELIDLKFYEYLFSQNLFRIGEAHGSSKDYYVPWVSGANGEYWRWCLYELNLFGDPDMPLWTDIPSTMTVDHEDTVTTGPSNFLVTVADGGSPIQGTLVCARKPGEVYEHGLTNSSGQIILPVSPVTIGLMDVTATAHNYLPYEGAVTVIARRDVGVLSIDAPPDTVDTNSVHTPRATVENLGDSAESFQVGCWFDSSGTTVYVDTQQVLSLGVGAQTQVSFVNWTSCSGTAVSYLMRVKTLLPIDRHPENDSLFKTITTIVNHDVGTISIDSPPDSVHSDSTYTPRATVRNYGDAGENFPVGCWFDSSGVSVYADTQLVAGLGSGSQTQVSFSNWRAGYGGLIGYQMTVRTLLSTDTDPTNDSQQKTVTTRARHDVETFSIEAPPDTVYCDSTYIPQALVGNLGNMVEDFIVFCTIDSFVDGVGVSALAPGSLFAVQFAPWTVPGSDSTTYLMTVNTMLAGDADPTNDTLQKSIFAHLVGVEEFVSYQLQATSYELGESIPNPFTAVTSVQFSVPAGFGDQQVSLCIYDISGRLVRALFDQVLTTGQLPLTAAVNWDGRDDSGERVVAGIYFSRIVCAGPAPDGVEAFSATKKVVVLR